jgi:hypothetical protein
MNEANGLKDDDATAMRGGDPSPSPGRLKPRLELQKAPQTAWGFNAETAGTR